MAQLPAAPSFVVWRPRWRNKACDIHFGPCVSFKKVSFPGPRPCAVWPNNSSRSWGEISIMAYSSRIVASMEKPSVQSMFSSQCCWEKKQKIRAKLHARWTLVWFQIVPLSTGPQLLQIWGRDNSHLTYFWCVFTPLVMCVLPLSSA